jgi:hypothetical protein
MAVNFSAFNMEYFLVAHNIINENRAFATAIFGVSPEFLRSVGKLTPHQVAMFAYIRVPLVVPREECTWWPRLMRAVVDGNRNELIGLSEEAAYYLLQSPHKD